jgi:hypothetical protein
MKNLTQITLAAAFAAIVTLANTASADGIAASPKVAQQLSERAAQPVASTPVSTVVYRTPKLENLAASPKVHQNLAERKIVVSGTPSAEVASASYNPTGADGITASPKQRAQFNERNVSIVIAPLK